MRRHIQGCGPVSESGRPEHRLSGDAIKLHTLLQPIPGVKYDVGVCGGEPCKTGRQKVILALKLRTEVNNGYSQFYWKG